MSIANEKIVNLQDAKVLYDDLRGRIKDNSVAKVLDTPADIQSFSDAARFPMELKVGIDPVQDLHGYDHPWIGGAGKNKCYVATAGTYNGIVLINNMDGSVTLTGTNDSSATYIDLFPGTFDSTVYAGYVFSYGDYSGSSSSVQVRISSSDRAALQNHNSGETIITDNGTGLYLSIRIAASYAIPSGGITLYPMLREPSATANWEPYENVCPITGWTGANVTVTGKNLLNTNNITDNTYIDVNGNFGTSNNYCLTDFIPVCGTFTMSGYNAVLYAASLGFYDATKNFISGVEYYKTADLTCVLPEGAKYVRVSLRKSMMETQQMEYGTTGTAYEPFGNTYSISFPTSTGTVYGGELTIHSDGSGELVVDHGVFDMGNATWTLAANNQLFRTNSPVDSSEIISGGIDGVCSCYLNAKGMTYGNFIATNGTYKMNEGQYSTSAKYIIVRDTSVSDAASFKTKMTGHTLTYDLATPITYSLTPGQVFALLGTNNVWADCGQINYLEYVRDTVGEVIPNRFDGIEQDIVETNTYEKTLFEANAIQSFDDGTNWPMGMQIAIEPVQEGSGDPSPSNVRPITGWTGANVTVTGKNLCAGLENGAVDPSTGEDSTYSPSTRLRTGWIRIKGNTQYTINGTGNNITPRVYVITMAGFHVGTVISADGWNELPLTFITDSNAEYVRFVFNGRGNPEITPASISNAQLEEGSANTSYESFGTTYPITFPTSAGTVYGGTLSVNKDGTGTLVVKYGHVAFDGTESWVSSTSLAGRYLVTQVDALKNNLGILCCSEYIPARSIAEVTARGYAYIDGNGTNARVGINSFIDTLSDWKSYLASQYSAGKPVQVVYELATPITYTLSAPQVLSLIGQNHVWADCGNILSLTYNSKQGLEFIREDTAGQINTVVNPVKTEIADVESSLAVAIDGDVAPTGGLVKGEFIFLRNHSTLACGIYHTTVAIAAGVSITTNNVSPETDGALNEINSHYAADASNDTDVPNQTVTLLKSITVDSDGFYLVERGCLWAKNTSGIRFISAENTLTPSNTRFKGDATNAVSDVNFYTSNKMLYYERLQKNDVLYVYGYQNSGTTLKAYPYIFAIKMKN